VRKASKAKREIASRNTRKDCDMQNSPGNLLLIGASRGLGHAMVAEFVKQGWNVVATTRPGGSRTQLHDLAHDNPGRVGIETVDICEPDQIAALRERLSGRMFDILFVNAGTANANANETIGAVATQEFIRVMVTNALGPMRCVETLEDLVSADGLIGVMSSGQGSIANNTNGGFEVYRGTKSALNQYMRSYAARNAGSKRALVLLAPGWIRTALGGPNAPFGIEESIPQIVAVLLAQQGKPGLQFLDRNGKAVPW
jgi:NAD(P)-dependent dehydrogenase (short-subunit alcohol dehydrogenase family)